MKSGLDVLFLNLGLQLLDFVIVEFLQKGNLFLQGFHSMLKVKMRQRSTANILSEGLQQAVRLLSLKQLLLQLLPGPHDVLSQ